MRAQDSRIVADDSFRPHDGHGHVSLGNASAKYSDSIALRLGNSSEFIYDMDEAGVEMAAISTPESMGWDNRLTLRAAAAFPNRFVAIVRINIHGSTWESDITKALAAGARGLRLSLHSETQIDWLLGRRLDPLWFALEAKAPVVVFHCRPDQLDTVGIFAREHPNIFVLIDHLGRPDVKKGVGYSDFRHLLCLAEHSNVYIKTANSSYFSQLPSPYLDLSVFIEEVLDCFGYDRLLWASDWPLCKQRDSYSDAGEPTRSLLDGLQTAALFAVFRANFEHIFCSAMNRPMSEIRS